MRFRMSFQKYLNSFGKARPFSHLLSCRQQRAIVAMTAGLPIEKWRDSALLDSQI